MEEPLPTWHFPSFEAPQISNINHVILSATGMCRRHRPREPEVSIPGNTGWSPRWTCDASKSNECPFPRIFYLRSEKKHSKGRKDPMSKAHLQWKRMRKSPVLGVPGDSWAFFLLFCSFQPPI